MGKFKDLKAWKRAVDLSVEIYKVARATELNNDYGLKDQMQRSSISISSNIAEGDELDTQKQSIRFFYIAKGSCAELYTQILIAERIGYFSNSQASSLKNESQEISAMLGKLISVRKQSIKP